MPVLTVSVSPLWMASSPGIQRPLIPSLSGCLSPCPNCWKLPKFCLKKRQKPKPARCLFRRNTDSLTWWLLFVHIKYKQPLAAIRLSAASLFFFPKQRSPPLTVSLPPSSHPSYPHTISTTSSLLRFLLRSLCISDETGSAREGEKKKKKTTPFG